jgi:hypothetical protein
MAIAVFAGCQDYNFNPVGHCIYQPGVIRTTLSDISTADILFVIDSSGSMEGEQTNLANNFAQFIQVLSDANVTRSQTGLEPFDYHIAVTDSSVFDHRSDGTNCTDIGGGTLRCCPQSCTPGGAGFPGCCSAEVCYRAGDRCGNLSHNLNFSVQSPSNPGGCIPGNGSLVNGQPAPKGSFLSAGGNPKVVHFEKSLYSSNPIDQAGINARIAQFTQNVQLGTCGMGHEMHFEAAKRSIEKMLANQQPGVTASEFMDASRASKSKLVVVWVADEDDCSTYDEANLPQSLIYYQCTSPQPNCSPNIDPQTGQPPPDSCQSAWLNNAGLHKPLADYDNFFHSLGRPFAAGFIVSTRNNTCQVGDRGLTCEPGTCSCQEPGNPPNCGAVSAGHRFLGLANMFRNRGDPVVVGQICDLNFSQTLAKIAEIVLPPQGLTLPTKPQAAEIVSLLQLDRNGNPKRVDPATGKPIPCNGPSTPVPDWWFTDCSANTAPYPEPTTCIYIDHTTGNCEINPGETYSAEYLGSVNASNRCNDATHCSTMLGGKPEDWRCEQGNCLCNARN